MGRSQSACGQITAGIHVIRNRHLNHLHGGNNPHATAVLKRRPQQRGVQHMQRRHQPGAAAAALLRRNRTSHPNKSQSLPNRHRNGLHSLISRRRAKMRPALTWIAATNSPPITEANINRQPRLLNPLRRPRLLDLNQITGHPQSSHEQLAKQAVCRDD